MGDVINLNKRRKAAIKEQADARAAENRALFGLPKKVKVEARLENDRKVLNLDLKRLD